MAAIQDSKQMLRDSDGSGKLIPQHRTGTFQDDATNTATGYEANKGHDGGQNVNPNPVAAIKEHHPYTAVASGGTQALAANPNRVLYRITNTGTTVLEIHWHGIPLTGSDPVTLLAPGAASRDGHGAMDACDRWSGIVSVRSMGDAAGGEFLATDL